jgi:hypothetical protein
MLFGNSIDHTYAVVPSLMSLSAIRLLVSGIADGRTFTKAMLGNHAFVNFGGVWSERFSTRFQERFARFALCHPYPNFGGDLYASKHATEDEANLSGCRESGLRQITNQPTAFARNRRQWDFRHEAMHEALALITRYLMIVPAR